MAQAALGDTVQVHYTGKLDDGTVFDSSANREPLEFTLGGGQVIPGFETGVLGMAPDEEKTVTIPVAEAYGEARQELIAQFPRDQFPDDFVPEVGQQLQLRQPNGQPIMVCVADVADDTVTLDANHPLAGKALTFELKLVGITPRQA